MTQDTHTLPSAASPSGASRGATPDEAPVRAELFGADRMARHARALGARHHATVVRHAPERLLPRLAQNQALIANACAVLTTAAKAGQQLTPACEWLLDNHYLIEEHMRTARRHLPHGYSRELPRLDGDDVPRVYRLAEEAIAHGDGRIDAVSLAAFMDAYQQEAVLTLGELWAIPIMLRLALAENLRRVAAQLLDNRAERDLASAWFERMEQTARRSAADLILVVADMARSEPPLSGGFVAELARRLHGGDSPLALAQQWLATRLSENGGTIEQAVQEEIQQQAAAQVSVANAIGSLRFIGALDWKEFVEALSHVEQTLRTDPDGTYPDMDFATRDMYRHAVEDLARRSGHTEVAVAEQALALAAEHRAPAEGGLDLRRRHVGYYLAGDGLPQLEQRLGARPAWRRPAVRANRRPRLVAYLGGMATLTALFTLAVGVRAWRDGLEGVPLVLCIVLFMLGMSQLALALVNFMANQLAQPRLLPRLDFMSGIPPTARTIAAVPAMLYSADNVRALLDGIEVAFLANRDPNLRFCLLTDWQDAPSEHMPGDEELLELARSGIAALNARYTLPGTESVATEDGASTEREAAVQPFLLLHRPRLWNPSEQVWMGHERKRGKLGDLNAFLRGRAEDRFLLIEGEVHGLDHVRYVLTLDVDTVLPPGAARQFIATIAHPLNQAQLAPDFSRVVDGYGILQPRLAATLPGEDATRYQALWSADAGIDPYTRAVSDVYQDVFAEGSFIGKGIYDVDVFERLLGHRFPDNRVLSHDLLEGCYLRCGLMSDLLLYEPWPSQYSADVSRRHRWIRGDWQIAGWLGRTVPTAAGHREPNPLGVLGRWKVLDNLRRSLVPAALTSALVLSWFLLPPDLSWTLAVLVVLFAPLLVGAVFGTLEKPEDLTWNRHLALTAQAVGRQLAQAALALAFLPHEGWYSIDAVVRSLWRMGVSRRRLLEWTPSALARSSANMASNWRNMWFSPVLAALVAVGLQLANPAALLLAAPFLLAWFLAPALAWWISLPAPERKAMPTPEQSLFLGRLARRTWHFFETYVTSAQHWLPPDNMQEHPTAVVAHRTSPTNIGLSLLANLAAWDFGYIGSAPLARRVRCTFGTLDKLERYNGHFLNWYDTRTLEPLPPRYVSAVDSGNLAGHLLTLAAGLDEVADQPIVRPCVFDGIATTLDVLEEAAGEHASVRPVIAQMRTALQAGAGQAGAASLPGLAERLTQARDAAAALLHAVEALREPAAEEAADAAAHDAAPPLPRNALFDWARCLHAQCGSLYADLLALAPWAGHAHAYVLSSALTRVPTLRELAAGISAGDGAAEQAGLAKLMEQGVASAAARLADLAELSAQARRYASEMDFTFLYDRGTRLLAIGYNASERRMDQSRYDLLASEMRLGAFVAIAEGQLPQESWFALGRQLASVAGHPLLLSWSGSMFEYLMPDLVMPTYRGTLLNQTSQAVVRAQMEYGRERQVPWGVSESGYHTFDAALNYQYRAFGVPGIGIRRGLGDDLVIAPYAAMLALPVDPTGAAANLERMRDLGFMGRYGFYEAVDYTQARLPRGQSFAIVRSFMAHHQGMGLLALDSVLNGQPMQRRFEADPRLRAMLLLLQERVPRAAPLPSAHAAATAVTEQPSGAVLQARVIEGPATPLPEVHLLSNGRYHVMVSSVGGGYSRHRDLAVTRWRADGVTDRWGMFCYVCDVESGAFWSTTYQPTRAEPDRYEAVFSEGRAEFRRRDSGIELHTEIVVSPEDDLEIRRTRVVNASQVRRTLEFTSYAELALAPQAADQAHPAFSKLFVQTETLPAAGAILARRRPRHREDHTPVALHLVSVHGAEAREVSFETSRAAFLGRLRQADRPGALARVGELGGGQGAVLDPALAIRVRIVLEPEEGAVLDFVTGVADNRDAALDLATRYRDRQIADRVFDLAWTHGQVVLRQLNASEADAQVYAALAAAVVNNVPRLRADPGVIARNMRGQSGLWAYSISGDLPIVLLRIRDPGRMDLARQLVQAHEYWRLKGLAADLVIWYHDKEGYRQGLRDQIMGLIASGSEAQSLDRPGGIFVRMLDQVPPEDQVLLESVARVVIDDTRGTLEDQLRRAAPRPLRVPMLGGDVRQAFVHEPVRLPLPELMLFNGTGGFTPDGREYVIRTGDDAATPAPWANVLANPSFGSVVSESGQACTWSENAHEFRLTPWDNDPVSDTSGEAFYVRDERSGHFWSPTPLPARGRGDYLTRHGFGYSVFEHSEDAIHTEMTVFVAIDVGLKYTVLRLRNDGAEPRRLSVTGYVEWVLGEQRDKSAAHVVTETDAASGALFARNGYNTEFAGRVAFFHADARNATSTGDREEFIGRNRSLVVPAAMLRARLSGRTGAGMDPCGAIMVPLELEPGEEREVVFVLGVSGRRTEDVSHIIASRAVASAAAEALAGVRKYWEDTLGAVTVETPDPALNVLANGWLVYQVIASRFWGRSGYYQSGGAFGFRDQLQDALALAHTQPQMLREQVLAAAARQFEQGDVQHWWHPPSGRGVRTRCSDDYLWLPFAAHAYVTATGDRPVLDEVVGFIDGRALGEHEESYYDLPRTSPQQASLYEHCVRAIRNGLRFGAHGVPLMGSGDWNDGMDRVGIEGKGESVWLGWFLCDVLRKFEGIAMLQGDHDFAATCREQAHELSLNLERHAWDGEWYRRAWFDDGTPLGTAGAQECQIDSISQSWAVLTGAGDPQRARKAMRQVDQLLVRRETQLVQLLDPPFDAGSTDPGYIRGYVPGVRENGGQYTHAAVWTAMAFARLGETERAWELCRMINPINHALGADDVERYRVEPYVMAADVYAAPGHEGRGGWTWYTGSAGWMYRLLVESLLGLEVKADRMVLKPLLPADWSGFRMRVRWRSSTYAISVERGPEAALSVDGRPHPMEAVVLVDDHAEHAIRLTVADAD